MSPTHSGRTRNDYRDEIGKLTLPSADSFAEMAAGLKLNQDQAWALERTVRNVINKARNHAQRQDEIPEHDIRNDRAEKIQDLLQTLEAEILKGSHTLDYIAPPENLGLLGSLLSFQAFAELAPNINFETGLYKYINDQEQSGAALSLIELEHRFQQPKQMFDLQNRTKVLIFLAKKMRQQFDDYLGAQSGRKSGAPSNWIREMILLDLARDASRIIGKRPTATAKGKFENLCSAVLYGVGIDQTGLKAAIERLIKKHKTDIAHWNAT
jgi:hypothetical protein